MTDISSRKDSHIELTQMAQASVRDARFDYEPLMGSFPVTWKQSSVFLGKKIDAPLWISSMTGGSVQGNQLNKVFAKAAAHFGLGMGLGSCRALLDDASKFDDFNLRPILGGELPFYANLGVAQVEELIQNKSLLKLSDLIDQLQADGVVIHINPLQEYFQPSGDRILRPALETLQELSESFSFNLVVKEVGQGMGPQSIAQLAKLDIQGIELAAFGGTNFTKIEGIRSQNLSAQDFSQVGHTAIEMIQNLNALKKNDLQVIISGGVNSVLDAFYLKSSCGYNSVIGKAGSLLKYAQEGESSLISHIENWLMEYRLAENYLKVKQ